MSARLVTRLAHAASLGGLFLCAIAMVVAMAIPARAVAVKLAIPEPSPSADLRDFNLVAVEVGRAVLWLPSTIVVDQGDEVRLTLRNLVPGRHSVQGFTIPGYNIKLVLTGRGPATVEFKAVHAGIFKYFCQLHPSDIGGQLLVRPRAPSPAKTPAARPTR